MESTVTVKKNGNSGEKLYKFFIYLVLILLAVSIIVPVAWVFMASIKENSEFYGNPWTCPPASTGRTSSTPGPRPAWATTCSTPSSSRRSRWSYSSSWRCPPPTACPGSSSSPASSSTRCSCRPVHQRQLHRRPHLPSCLRDGDTWLKSVFRQRLPAQQHRCALHRLRGDGPAFTIYLLSGYFATLAHDYEEAAYIDGAGYGRTMISIIFPMAQPRSSPSSSSTSSRSGTNTSSP